MKLQLLMKKTYFLENDAKISKGIRFEFNKLKG